MSDAIDWARVRADFPILDQQVNGQPLIYFDNAATSQKPRAVIDALVRYYEHDNANVHRGLHELSNRATDAYEGARAKVARIHRRGERRRSSSPAARPRGSISWRRSGRENFLKPGDVILLTEMEHHSNLVPWQLAAKRSGATSALRARSPTTARSISTRSTSCSRRR